MAENPVMQNPAIQSPPAQRADPSLWAIGYTAFAGCSMVLAGSFQAMLGLVGLINAAFYQEVPSYVFRFDNTSWGRINLFLGSTVMAAGIGLLFGQIWARIVGVILDIVSTFACFAWLPHYPFWAVLVIALNVAISWALTMHGRDITM
jgi:hypothetical protein